MENKSISRLINRLHVTKFYLDIYLMLRGSIYLSFFNRKNSIYTLTQSKHHSV